MNYKQHIYRSNRVESLLEEILRFFETTPLLKLTDIKRFHGSGVYVIYYNGEFQPYEDIPNTRPLYAGKAVPKGWRQARQGSDSDPQLYRRLREHIRSIEKANNLDVNDFDCRIVILPGPAADLIGSVENALVRRYQPLWNVRIDGFGNHDPGKGRYDQAPSEWDTLHPGRSWVKKLTGTPPNHDEIIKKIERYVTDISS